MKLKQNLRGSKWGATFKDDEDRLRGQVVAGWRRAAAAERLGKRERREKKEKRERGGRKLALI
jgi:hypothetical protein